MGGVDLDDVQFEKRDCDPWTAYGQSKTANALFALEFQRRFGSCRVSTEQGLCEWERSLADDIAPYRVLWRKG